MHLSYKYYLVRWIHTAPHTFYTEEQVTHLVTVGRLGIRVGAQGARTHHEKEESKEGPHDSQQHRVLHATLTDGGSRPWHCKRLLTTINFFSGVSRVSTFCIRVLGSCFI